MWAWIESEIFYIQDYNANHGFGNLVHIWVCSRPNKFLFLTVCGFNYFASSFAALIENIINISVNWDDGILNKENKLIQENWTSFWCVLDCMEPLDVSIQ